jgi:hypothetical protein
MATGQTTRLRSWSRSWYCPWLRLAASLLTFPSLCCDAALGQSSDEEDDSGAQNLSPHTASRDSRSDVKDIAEEKGETSSALGISEKVRAKTVQYKLEKKAAHAKPTMSFGQKRELSKVFDELSPAFSKVEFAAEQAKRTAEKVSFRVCIGLLAGGYQKS